jgi:hypothetical protein
MAAPRHRPLTADANEVWLPITSVSKGLVARRSGDRENAGTVGLFAIERRSALCRSIDAGLQASLLRIGLFIDACHRKYHELNQCRRFIAGPP